MALFQQSALKQCVALAVFIFMVTATVASENVEKRLPPSFAEVVPSDVWFLNDSVKALVEPTNPNTILVSYDDGTVQAWKKRPDTVLWSFLSGPPLVSFHWFSAESSSKEADEGEADEGEWYVDGPEVSIEKDGELSVRDALNRTKALKLTLQDLREGSVHARRGEIIHVDRRIAIFLLDAETGAIVRTLGNDNTGEDLNFEQQKKSIFVIRTDYIAKASNLSGTSLWSLSYGEIGTLMTGLQTPTHDMASLTLVPKLHMWSPGVPYRIAAPLTQPAALVGQAVVPGHEYLNPGEAVSVYGEHKPGQSSNLDPLALLPGPAPPSLPLPKPALAIWGEHEPSINQQTHAPAMIAPPKPPKPTTSATALYTAGAGFIITMAILLFILTKNFVTTKVSPAPPPIKKKGRKGSRSQQEILTATSSQESYSNRVKPQVNGSGTKVGRLFVSNNLIGSGSNGTLVLEGYLDGRKVAVKRLLAQYYEKAQKEIALLIASDEHPNVVRYYATEETADFVYVSLERCSFSLYDLILAQTSQGPGMERQVKECLAGKGLKLRSVEDFNLWHERGGRPSPQLFQVMRDIVAGLAHLHAVGIVHRDLKPHNVLISGGLIMQAKIADMGLSKQLDDDAVSFDTLTGHGSSGSRGWQAPEQLLRGRGSRAVDIFSLGCVLYHCITGGKHPFGSHLERDGNIVYGKMDLFHIVDFPEATDLIERLLDPDPRKRPPAQDILLHPFFWESEKCLSFLKDASDRVELDMKDSNSILFADLESLESSVLCGGWDGKLDSPLLHNIRGYRRYNFKSVRDLLRVIRNKANHFRELPEQLQLLLGPIPDGVDNYFRSRFPRLLIEIYQVIGHHCRAEASFEKYYPESYVPKFGSSDVVD